MITSNWFDRTLWAKHCVSAWLPLFRFKFLGFYGWVIEY